MNDLTSFHLLKRDGSQRGAISGFRFGSRILKTAYCLMLSASVATFSLGNQSAQAAGELSLPVWEELFNPDGGFKDEVGTFTGEVDEFGVAVQAGNGVPDYIDIHDGIEAEFIQDNISNGIATDMSVLQDAEFLSDTMLYNGTVAAQHDLGSAYFLAAPNSQGNPQIYVAVERLYIEADTYIEFEFNQDRIGLEGGAPWALTGARTDGDLLIRMNFIAGSLASVDFDQWQQGFFQNIDWASALPGANCTDQTTFIFCLDSPPAALDHPVEGFEVWDAERNLVQGTPPDDFVELGIDIVGLLGARVDYNSLLIRTPEDIAMNSFRVLGQMAQFSSP